MEKFKQTHQREKVQKRKKKKTTTDLGGGSNPDMPIAIKISHQQNASQNALITCIGTVVPKTWHL